MGGVLDGIGEDEGFLVGVIQLGFAEEVGQCHRQQGGDRGSEVADGILGAAGGAGLLFRTVFAVVSGVAEDRDDLAGFEGLLVGALEQQVGAGEIQPVDGGVGPGVPADGVIGGVEEGSLEFRAPEGAGTDLRRRGFIADVAGQYRDHPAGPSADAAVAGGEPAGVIVLFLWAVIGPAEHVLAGIGADDAVDPGDFPDPQVCVHPWQRLAGPGVFADVVGAQPGDVGEHVG